MPAPATEQEVADRVLAAHAAGEPLWVHGRETKKAMMRPVQAARGLSTRNLTGITLYSPTELIISARAGTLVSDIEATLAGQGQHLIAEPPDFSTLLGSTPDQTIGGVVATNLSGPRRIAWGAMRDHVMGLHFVNGSGELLHMGGRVLKNVTGLDICKLLTGSHGTLGVITEVTLKVLPAPERRATLVLAGLDPVRGVAALSEALGSPYAVSGAAYLPESAAALVPALSWMGGSVTLARLEDFAPSVVYRADRLRADLAAYGKAELLDDGATRAVWAAIRDALPLPAAHGQAVWRVSVRPSAGPAVVAALERAVGAAWFLDWGGGLAWIAGPATEAAHEAVCAAALWASGTWTLVRAPDALRTALAVIPPEAPGLARISARVKAAFDPRSILNPGRLHAGHAEGEAA
jgi:glycolate oxidase FAD binding subunit